MSGRSVAVVTTGIANVRSVLAGLERAGACTSTTDRPEVVRDAEHVVLPGVGSFGAGAERLRATELDIALRERIAADRPLLAVCLGLQLLAKSSEETPGAAGLSVFDAHVARFGHGLRVPQIGWNRVDGLLGGAHWFYFANSYRLVDVPPGWRAATADHGGRFVAALERGHVLACQFHPELSGAAGQLLLQRWLAGKDVCSQPA